jgi:hypothetical protein
MTGWDGTDEFTYLANVDLDIYSRRKLQPLVDALGKKVFVLFVGKWGSRHKAVLEVSRAVRDADSTIRKFCQLIRALPPEARAHWDRATKRDFNIGIVSAHKPHCTAFVVKESTVREVAELGGRIMLTVYPPQKPSRRRR